MNCFQIRNHTSDILDGTLKPEDKKQIETHLVECEPCSEELKHFRIILSSIATSPRIAVPQEKKNHELLMDSRDLRRTRVQRLRKRWRTLPWYIRTTLEGTGIVFLVLLSISAGPRLRMFYERQIERNVTEFSDTFSESAPDGLSAGDLPVLTKGKTGNSDSAGIEEEVDGGNAEYDGESEIAEPQDSAQDISVGNSEIWRFILKTDSPKEIRNRIVQILSELKISRDTPGLGGIEAPGGIQFDLLVPISAISSIKRQLQKISAKAPEGLTKAGSLETFAWYRNKSRKSLPAGKTRIVIWLSQI
ncbi:MAG: hypothetical protein A2070_14095 [Bdellovibrionales bacterium GWC1_52_8]|nr:MAG: hypothetical protein A2X97_08200 [Bdellovibrionales bacterium GWA1_52_35]OFZ43906.1 MAG: hypothetical protein A2070_14095 [Bdellovibrionales bacterium GWC1_52_8]